MKRGIWAAHLANALGNSSPDALTLNWVSAWTVAEGTKARFNPLATCKDMDGATPFNLPHCVKEYGDHETGIQATVKTLMHGYPGYEDIREGIRTNDPERSMRGLYAAPWGTNGSNVERTWRSRDTRDEELLSHPAGDVFGEGSSSGGSWDVKPKGDGSFLGNAIGYASTSVGSATEVTTSATGIDVANLAARAAMGILGTLCIIFALGLAVRTYVPTQQIVKTVADVAL